MSSEIKKANSSRPKPTNRYILTFDYNRSGALGFKLEDESLPLWGQWDFACFSKPPVFIFDRKRGRLPTDLELYNNFWLVTEHTKSVFEAVDSPAFEFCECKVRLRRGDYGGPRYWLCNVVRVVDALDEEKSQLKEIGIRDDPRYIDFGKKYYDITGRHSLVFRDDVIAHAHIFRMEYLRRTIICDQTLKDACKAAGLKGLKFDGLSNF